MSVSDTTTLGAPELHDVVGWLDARVRDSGGRRVGRVRAVFADAHGTPWWIVVRHRGRDVVAPVSSVYAKRHRELLLDRAADSLAPSTGEIDEATHNELMARFALTQQPAREESGGRFRRVHRVVPRRD